jgi:hypothetical protein
MQWDAKLIHFKRRGHGLSGVWLSETKKSRLANAADQGKSRRRHWAGSGARHGTGNHEAPYGGLPCLESDKLTQAGLFSLGMGKIRWVQDREPTTQ